MDTQKELVRLLGLTAKERKVLRALKEGACTPLQIARETKVTRPAVYAALARFKERGIATTRIEAGRKYWSIAKRQDLEEVLYDAKCYLADLAEGVQEVRGKDDATVIVHRGAEAVRTVLQGMILEHKNERIFGFQGDVVGIGWTRVFGVEGTNALNRAITKNRIIIEGVLPEGWFERQAKVMGPSWAKDFEGRAAITHFIGREYFEHGGQLWMMKDSLYLIAMNEELIIEVHNSDIQRAVLALFRFVQDHSPKLDINAILRRIIAEGDGK